MSTSCVEGSVYVWKELSDEDEQTKNKLWYRAATKGIIEQESINKPHLRNVIKQFKC